VRWAACQALGQLCTDLFPELQEEHARILKALMPLMNDFAHPRGQAHAAAAIVNFTEGGDLVQISVSTPPPPSFPLQQLHRWPGPGVQMARAMQMPPSLACRATAGISGNAGLAGVGSRRRSYQ